MISAKEAFTVAYKYAKDREFHDDFTDEELKKLTEACHIASDKLLEIISRDIKETSACGGFLLNVSLTEWKKEVLSIVRDSNKDLISSRLHRNFIIDESIKYLTRVITENRYGWCVHETDEYHTITITWHEGDENETKS